MNIIRADDKYRNRWHFDEIKQEWEGNPACSAAVGDMLDACKNKDGEGERKHSQAMSIEDMKKLYKNSKKCCPEVDLSQDVDEQRENLIKRAWYLLFDGMSASAFTIWMRCVELIADFRT